MSDLLTVKHLSKSYRVKTGAFRYAMKPVLDDISFRIQSSQIVSVVGESGSGKSTLARQLVMLETPESGELLFHGRPYAEVPDIHQKIRMIFQNPLESLNPRRTVYRQLEVPLLAERFIDRKTARIKILSVMNQVGLHESLAGHYPHMLSGGQRQRVAIARALIVEPGLVIADEAVSALDVSVQSQILNLVLRLREELSMAWLFITHDIGVARCISDYLVVLYAGRVVESGTAKAVIDNPLHPYTQKLIESVPGSAGRPASLLQAETMFTMTYADHSRGCRYRPYCSLADDVCAREQPESVQFGERSVSCFKVKAREKAFRDSHP